MFDKNGKELSFLSFFVWKCLGKLAFVSASCVGREAGSGRVRHREGRRLSGSGTGREMGRQG
jgi:hypothetical protein